MGFGLSYLRAQVSSTIFANIILQFFHQLKNETHIHITKGKVFLELFDIQ